DEGQADAEGQSKAEDQVDETDGHQLSDDTEPSEPHSGLQTQPAFAGFGAVPFGWRHDHGTCSWHRMGSWARAARKACLGRSLIPDRGLSPGQPPVGPGQPSSALAGGLEVRAAGAVCRLPRPMQKPMSHPNGAPPPVSVRELRKIYRDITAVD